MDSTRVNLSSQDLNKVLHSFDDDPNNEIRTYTDSPYVTLDSLVSLLSKKMGQFSILDLNTQSLSSKFDAFSAFLSLLDEKGIRFSAICLQETWLSDKHETSIFNLPGYRLIHAGKSCSDCGGLMIYLSNLFSCNVKHVHNSSSLWEGLFIEVQGGTLESKLISGNIYRPPRHNNNNANIENFLTEITPVISNIAKNSCCNIVVSGDFNIDLLQINDRVKYQKYFDVFVTNSLFPLITLPTRESKHSSTLIDQIFCNLKNFRDLDSPGIFISSLSDHYPCFALLDICKKKHKPKFITINNKNEQALTSFCTEVETSLNKWQINNDLMTDPNENYNIFEKIILDAKTKHLSPKSVRFKKYKHKISPWINNDILRSIRERDDLHKTLVSTASDAPNHDMLKHDLQNLKATLKKIIRGAKAKYYADIFDKNKSNIRHTWAAIKEILGKFKNKHEFPDYFTLDGKMISDSLSIANCFNIFFSKVGLKLAENITYNGTKSVSSYLFS